MKSLTPLLLILAAAAICTLALAGETGIPGSSPRAAIGPDGKPACIFFAQTQDNKSLIVRAPLSNGSIGTPERLVSTGAIRFTDLVLANDSTGRIFAVASLPRLMTRHGFTAAERDYAFQPVVTCFEVRKKSAASADSAPEYFIVSVSPNPMFDLECASRSCAVLADGDNSVLILDSNGFLAPSTTAKFWAIGKPARIFTDDAFAIALAKGGETYHVFYATESAGAVKLHHLTSRDLTSWKTASVPGMAVETKGRLCAVAAGNGISLAGTQQLENGERAVIVSMMNPDGTWSQPQTVVSGDNVSGNFDAVGTSDGSIHIAYEEISQDGKTFIRCITRPANQAGGF
ncbi:MAG: hypothetical protein ACYS8W_10480 [Planctomycetota bacterium]|jgi:hypothetical protein